MPRVAQHSCLLPTPFPSVTIKPQVNMTSAPSAVINLTDGRPSPTLQKFHNFQLMPVELQYMVIDNVKNVFTLITAAKALYNFSKASHTLNEMVEPAFTKLVNGDFKIAKALLKTAIETSDIPLYRRFSTLLTDPLSWADGVLKHATSKDVKNLFSSLRRSAQKTPNLKLEIFHAFLNAKIPLFAGDTPTRAGHTKAAFAILIRQSSLASTSRQHLDALLNAHHRKFHVHPKNTLSLLFEHGGVTKDSDKPSAIDFNCTATIDLLIEHNIDLKYLLESAVSHLRFSHVVRMISKTGPEYIAKAVIKLVLQSSAGAEDETKRYLILQTLLSVQNASKDVYIEALATALAQNSVNTTAAVLDFYDRHFFRNSKTELQAGPIWGRFVQLMNSRDDEDKAPSLDAKIALLYERGFKFKGADSGLHNVWNATDHGGYPDVPAKEVVMELVSAGASVSRELATAVTRPRPVREEEHKNIKKILDATDSCKMDAETVVEIAKYSTYFPGSTRCAPIETLRKVMSQEGWDNGRNTRIIGGAMRILRGVIDKKVAETVKEEELLGLWVLANVDESEDGPMKCWKAWWRGKGQVIARRLREDGTGAWGNKVPLFANKRARRPNK